MRKSPDEPSSGETTSRTGRIPSVTVQVVEADGDPVDLTAWARSVVALVLKLDGEGKLEDGSRKTTAPE